MKEALIALSRGRAVFVSTGSSAVLPHRPIQSARY
jgi:hypothetical protein